MSHPKPSTTTNDLKHRVITCLNKLSDRDTLFLATAELHSIAKNLNHDSFSPFLNCIHNTDSSFKSPVRKQCVTLLTLLTHSHGNSLSPHLSKMISTVARRLRDPDSAVRSACIEAAIAMSSQITKPPFSTLSKPLFEMLSLEQNFNVQIGAAMCLAAAIAVAPDPEVEKLRKVLPRLGKLLKSEGFKAKAALLSVIGSIVGVRGGSSKAVLDWLVPCLVEFLSSEDWAARKAASEALGKVAVAEKELAKDHKAACMSALGSRRFDKVKAVRETMNRTLELWKLVPGVFEEISIPSPSRSSIVDNTIGGCSPSSSKSSHDVSFKTPVPKKAVPASSSPPSDVSFLTTTKRQSPVKSNDSNSNTGIIPKLDHKKPSNWKIEIAVQQETINGSNIKMSDYGVLELRGKEKNGNFKRVLFNSICDEQPHKFSGLKSAARVVPYHNDENCYEKDVEVFNPTEEFYENQKDTEDLSMIREQLVQIENQQSSLLDLLQRFIGSSQNGINSLEMRVHGLEIALDEISYDLAVSSGRIPNMDSAENTCCKLPGTEFLSSKFWRRIEGRYSTLRFSSHGSVQPMHDVQNIPDKYIQTETYNPDNQIFQHQNNGGFLMNPLEDIHTRGRGNSGICSSLFSIT